VKDNLERNGERSLTGVQALLLYEIGESETPASALRARGSFAGTSMSYNVKKLQEGGYLVQSRSSDDRRTVRLKLTPSGKAVRNTVAELFEKQAGALEPTASVRADDLDQLNKALARLERFWSDQIRYQL
jgi:DNA-binding MarR family transcriptional regulator